MSAAETEILLLSLKVAFWAVIGALPVALALAMLLARADFPGKTLLDGLVNLPLVLRGGLLAASPTRFWPGSIARKSHSLQPRILSIGGAGIFDGVFLAGIIAAFLATR